MLNLISLEMKIRYLERRLGEVQIMKNDLDQRNYESTLWYSHQIKVNAETYTYNQIGDVASELESYCQVKNYEKALQSLGKLGLLIQQEIQIIHP